MGRRLFEVDPVSGKRKWFYWNDEDKSFTIETEQDVTDLVEHNTALQNADTDRYGEWNRVASVPVSVYWDLKQRGIIDDPKKLKAWLNDSDNRKFRTKLGAV